MKKSYRGFTLVETLIVSAFIIGILIFLFSQFTKLKKSYDTSFENNTIPALYKARNINRYLYSVEGEEFIAKIEASLLSLPYVSKVVYQRDVVKVLDRHLGEVGVILSLVAIALLVIALVLISNTIQLQVYSKRFLINTMRLVGATPWVIKWPLIRRNLLMGFEASLIALILLAFSFYYCQARLGVMLFPLTWVNICIVIALVMIFGLLITFFASLGATNRYIRMNINKMYEI